MVKHRQLVPTMGPISGDLPTNSMSSPNFDNALEKGTTFTFGSLTCVEDGLGGFTNHLANQESSNPLPPPKNSATQDATTQNPPEDLQEEETFHLIKRYWTDSEATPIREWTTPI